VTGSGTSNRERILAAAIRLFGTKGYRATSAEAIAAAAGLERADFQAEFAGKRECFLAVWDQITVDYATVVLEAYNRHESWLDRLREAAYASFEYLRENPLRARIGSVEVLYAGDEAQARRDLFLQSQVELVHAGRFELDEPDSVPRSAAETAVGAIWDTLVNAIRHGRLGTSTELVPQLMYIAVLPYLGPEMAARELTGGSTRTSLGAETERRQKH
jgi:AcrR family transcriptional regulator